MSVSGSFESHGYEVQWELLEIHDYEGNVYADGEAEEHLHEADRAFYSITSATYVNEGPDASSYAYDVYHRWVAGPFESIGDLEAAISDEADFYEAFLN